MKLSGKIVELLVQIEPTVSQKIRHNRTKWRAHSVCETIESSRWTTKIGPTILQAIKGGPRRYVF